MMPLEGGCHCGNLRLRLHLTTPPADTPVRTCQCTFCRAHGARTVADPDGEVVIATSDRTTARKYRFGLQTADYILCVNCGVYIAAVASTAAGLRATVNINALHDRHLFSSTPQVVSYDGETAEGRLARRTQRWMPASLID